MPRSDAAKAQSELEERMLVQIGAFVFSFSQVEGALRSALAEALSVPGELYDAVTASYDFRTLCNARKKVAQLLKPQPHAISAADRPTPLTLPSVSRHFNNRRRRTSIACRSARTACADNQARCRGRRQWLPVVAAA